MTEFHDNMNVGTDYRFAVDIRTNYSSIEFIPKDLVNVTSQSISMGVQSYLVTPIKAGELTVVFTGENVPDVSRTSIIK